MYRELIKWIIVGFAAVPPHAIAEEAAGALVTAESAFGTTQALGDMALFAPPQVVGALSLTGTALLLTATTVYYFETSQAKRIFREAREQAREALARGDKAPVSAFGADSSLAMAVEIEKRTFINQKRAVPALTEREWATAVYVHAAELEVL